MHFASKQWFLNVHIRIFQGAVCLFLMEIVISCAHLLRFRMSKSKVGPRSAFKAPSALTGSPYPHMFHSPRESDTHGPRRISLTSKRNRVGGGKWRCAGMGVLPSKKIQQKKGEIFRLKKSASSFFPQFY